MKSNAEDFLLVKRNIIKKLYANKAFSKGHLLVERLHSGIPKHLIGLVDKALVELVKGGLVVHYGKTKHGDAYQLSVKNLKEIEESLFGEKSTD